MSGLRLVVVGDPVDHSLSPVMHTAALASVGLEGTYEKLAVDAAGLGEVASEMRSGRWDGVNITMPHKRLAAELSDRLAALAYRAQSVNTWVPRHGAIEGHSTDIVGVRRVFERLPDGPIVVLGTGGAAAATVVAMEGRPMTVVARRPQAAVAMVERCGAAARVVGWDGPVPAGVVVNCTPVGMAGEALEDRLLHSATGYFEMVYASGPTPAERAARERGIPVTGGLELLAAQAEVSFELWTGQAPPAGVMYRSVDKYLKGSHGGTES